MTTFKKIISWVLMFVCACAFFLPMAVTSENFGTLFLFFLADLTIGFICYKILHKWGFFVDEEPCTDDDIQ